MYYLIYKTTNIINNKIYIGKHKTKSLNDGYVGSGKLLSCAIQKYGIENFIVEILYFCKSEEELNIKEKELVTEEFCLREDTYNLCVGGQGGFSYINRNNIRGMLGKKQSKKQREAASNFMIRNNSNRARHKEISSKGGKNSSGMLGKQHSEKTKEKLSLSKKGKTIGSSNSQFGTKWITNGQENKKIKKEDFIPKGWYNGRTMRP